MNYDSVYLSNVLLVEKEKVRSVEKINEYTRIKSLYRELNKWLRKIGDIEASITTIKEDLKIARILAEKDLKNLKRLEELFLECLLSAKVPGFKDNDIVEISSPSFFPVISNPKTGDLLTTSFSTLGSGGKKTLFKVSFLIAIHRITNEIEANLPPIMLIDTPMKNISERANKTQFQNFYSFLYALSQDELKNHQIFIVDKEFYPPDKELVIDLISRYMTPDTSEHPPLISYYRGR